MNCTPTLTSFGGILRNTRVAWHCLGWHWVCSGLKERGPSPWRKRLNSRTDRVSHSFKHFVGTSSFACVPKCVVQASMSVYMFCVLGEVHACRSLQMMSQVLLECSLPFIWRQDLSIKPRTHSLGSLWARMLTGYPLSVSNPYNYRQAAMSSWHSHGCWNAHTCMAMLHSLSQLPRNSFMDVFLKK